MSEAEYVPQAWRMTDYYPDTYAKFMSALGIGIDYDDADFDRYHAEFLADLAEHDRQVAERAWDEGLDAQKDYAWRCEDADAAGQGVWVRPPENPYRAAKGEQSGSLQDLGGGVYRVPGARVDPQTGRYITNASDIEKGEGR